MKRITKKERGGGKADVEEPSSSISAQEQAKLAAKQDKEKETQVHCPSPPCMPAVRSEGKPPASKSESDSDSDFWSCCPHCRLNERVCKLKGCTHPSLAKVR